MMAREVQDHYFHLAKREGYASRAAYKLIEIDDRKKLLRRGDWVLDCGAAPGSWLQVAATRVGPRGVVVGIDLKPITAQFETANIRCIEGDFAQTPAAALLQVADEGRPGPFSSEEAGESGPSSLRSSGPASGGARTRLFDVVLSDMAPPTCGDRTADHHRSVRLCHAVLDRCGELLKPGGHVAMKVFEGEAYPDLIQRTRHLFEHVKGFVPKASRHQSTEIYVVTHGFRGPQSEESQTTEAPAELPPRRRPAHGWGAR